MTQKTWEKLSPQASAIARAEFVKHLPEWLRLEGGKALLCTLDDISFADAYTRVVVGDYGAYIEFGIEDCDPDKLIVQPGQEYRMNNPYYRDKVKYDWLTVKGSACSPKIYHQKRTVSYADYNVGMYYIDPFEVKLAKDRFCPRCGKALAIEDFRICVTCSADYSAAGFDCQPGSHRALPVAEAVKPSTIRTQLKKVLLSERYVQKYSDDYSIVIEGKQYKLHRPYRLGSYSQHMGCYVYMHCPVLGGERWSDCGEVYF